VIQKELQNALAKELLAGQYMPGDTVFVVVEGGELSFEREAFDEAS
jgi:ATP-dependent Clp protease ATP-binding subunit ClpA